MCLADDFARRVIDDFVPFALHSAVLVGQLERGLDLVIVAGAIQALREIIARHLVVDLAGHCLDLAVLELDRALTGPIAAQFLEGVTGLGRRIRPEPNQGGGENDHCALCVSNRHSSLTPLHAATSANLSPVAAYLCLCRRTRSACAFVISPPATSAEMQRLDTPRIERDIQARKPSLP